MASHKWGSMPFASDRVVDKRVPEGLSGSFDEQLAARGWPALDPEGCRGRSRMWIEHIHARSQNELGRNTRAARLPSRRSMEW